MSMCNTLKGKGVHTDQKVCFYTDDVTFSGKRSQWIECRCCRQGKEAGLCVIMVQLNEAEAKWRRCLGVIFSQASVRVWCSCVFDNKPRKHHTSTLYTYRQTYQHTYTNLSTYKTTPQRFPNSQNWGDFLTSISDKIFRAARFWGTAAEAITATSHWTSGGAGSGGLGQQDGCFFPTSQTWSFWCRLQLCSSWTQVQAPGSWTHVRVPIHGSGVFPVPSRLPPEMLINILFLLVFILSLYLCRSPTG